MNKAVFCVLSDPDDQERIQETPDLIETSAESEKNQPSVIRQ